MSMHAGITVFTLLVCNNVERRFSPWLEAKRKARRRSAGWYWRSVAPSPLLCVCLLARLLLLMMIVFFRNSAWTSFFIPVSNEIQNFRTGLCRAAERAFFSSGKREGRSREGGRSGLYGRLCTLKQEGNEPWMGTRISNPSFKVIVISCRTKLLGTGK